MELCFTPDTDPGGNLAQPRVFIEEEALVDPLAKAGGSLRQFLRLISQVHQYPILQDLLVIRSGV